MYVQCSYEIHDGKLTNGLYGFGLTFSIFCCIKYNISFSRIQFDVLCIGDGFVRTNNPITFSNGTKQKKKKNKNNYKKYHFFEIAFLLLFFLSISPVAKHFCRTVCHFAFAFFVLLSSMYIPTI